LISSTDPGPSSNSNDERIARDSYLLHRRRSPVTVGAGPEATTSSDVAPSPVYLARSVTPLYFALMHASQIYNTNKYSTNKKKKKNEVSNKRKKIQEPDPSSWSCCGLGWMPQCTSSPSLFPLFRGQTVSFEVWFLNFLKNLLRFFSSKMDSTLNFRRCI